MYYKQLTLRGIALLCLLFTSLPLWATERDCLLLHLQSGERMVFMLEAEPQIFFTESGIEIGLHSLTLSEVTKYTFGDSENLPEDLSNVTMQDGISFYDGMLLVSLKENNALSIFTVTGQEIMCKPVWQHENKIMVDLNFLPNGMYVISTGEETLKIMKK